MKVDLKGVQETLLIPLAARAFESKSKTPRIKDEKAVEILNKIEYDFEKFKGKLSQEGVIARTIILDREVEKFIEKNKEATCISIGCGLDTRYYRIDHGNVQWYNIDFPEVIALRKSLLSEDKNVHFIGKSALDKSWVQDVSVKNTKVLIIIEGMLMYLKKDELISLLSIIKNNFPGSIILAEIMHPLIAKHSKQHDTVKRTDATFKFGVPSGKYIEKLCEGVHFCEEWNLVYELKNTSSLFTMVANIPFVRDKSNKIVKLLVQGDNYENV